VRLARRSKVVFEDLVHGIVIAEVGEIDWAELQMPVHGGRPSPLTTSFFHVFNHFGDGGYRYRPAHGAVELSPCPALDDAVLNMSSVMKSCDRDGLPSRPSFRHHSTLALAAAALSGLKVVLPRLRRLFQTPNQFSFLRLKIVDAQVDLP